MRLVEQKGRPGPAGEAINKVAEERRRTQGQSSKLEERSIDEWRIIAKTNRRT